LTLSGLSEASEATQGRKTGFAQIDVRKAERGVTECHSGASNHPAFEVTPEAMEHVRRAVSVERQFNRP
jgi:hypothetical protein